MDLFSSPIGRLAFLGRYALGLVLLAAGIAGLEVADESESMILMCLSVVVMVAATAYVTIFGFLPRLESVGLSGWFVVVFMIPVANFILLLFLFFCPAGLFANRDEVA